MVLNGMLKFSHRLWRALSLNVFYVPADIILAVTYLLFANDMIANEIPNVVSFFEIMKITCMIVSFMLCLNGCSVEQSAILFIFYIFRGSCRYLNLDFNLPASQLLHNFFRSAHSLFNLESRRPTHDDSEILHYSKLSWQI